MQGIACVRPPLAYAVDTNRSNTDAVEEIHVCGLWLDLR
jgi:hypothetical protein